MLQASSLANKSYDSWPALPLDKWQDTYAGLHMWTQIVGKIELKLNPLINHWWETALLVTPRGLATYPIYYQQRCFEIEFNFLTHVLNISVSDGASKHLPLTARSVSEFYFELMKLLDDLGIHLKINTMPQEIPSPVSFPEDKTQHAYQKEYVRNFHQILLQTDRLMKVYRGHFTGKASPVHFFWGSFDLACSRFSGREAEQKLSSDRITKEAYSHEVMSVGFWPGSGDVRGPAFYAYVAPEPAEFKKQPVQPLQASYHPSTKGFILEYEHLRNSENPDQMLLNFFESTYEAAAITGKWDRKKLERNFH
jgi:hypothetical protein